MGISHRNNKSTIRERGHVGRGRKLRKQKPQQPDKQEQREHKPDQLGPRVEFRGRWASLDLRPWGGKRYTPARNPKHPDWPHAGSKTTDEGLAREWGWAHVAWYEDRTKRASRGHAPAPERVERVVEEYLADRARKNKRAATVSGDRSALYAHFVPWCGKDARMDQILVAPEGTSAEMPGYLYLSNLVEHMIDKGYQASMIKQTVAKIKTFLRKSGRRHLDFSQLELPAVDFEPARFWTDEEIQQVREAADWWDANVRNQGAFMGCPSGRLLVELLFSTGVRHQEAFAVKWMAFDPRKQSLRVTEQYCRHTRSMQKLKAESEKRGKERKLWVLPEWWEWYEAHRGRGLVLEMDDGRPVTHTLQRLMLTNERLSDMTRNYQDQAPGILDVAGLKEPGVRYHAFRHSYARVYLENHDGTLLLLKQFLGHESIMTTEKVYGHLTEDRGIELARENAAAARRRTMQQRPRTSRKWGAQ